MTGKRQNAYFRKLLVGYDGSPQSEKAVDVAFSLAECLDATVLIFAVARPPEPSTSRDLHVNTDMAVGHPAEQIIHRAEVDGIDLIILGRRGRSMISRMMLGSVSERALRYAHCPVMVVH
jgi:nucleotide-binding universal stress UspA family protein